MTTAVETKTTKTITATQRRAIEKLIKNDFETLETELYDFENAEHARLSAEFNAISDAYEQKVAKALERINAQTKERVAKVIADAADAGFEVSLYRDQNIEVRSVQQKAAQAEHSKAVHELRERAKAARNALRRRRLNIERDLILASLTSEDAMDFINQIPTVRELMENAQPALAG